MENYILTLTQAFLDPSEKIKDEKNQASRINQNTSKKLKVSAQFEKRTINIDPNKGENTLSLLKCD